MGQIQIIHDESWRAARLVVKRFETRLDDAELMEAFSAVKDLVAESIRRAFERRGLELRWLAKNPNAEVRDE
jgi:hypothetical protein